jgi:hypothetical protein
MTDYMPKVDNRIPTSTFRARKGTNRHPRAPPDTTRHHTECDSHNKINFPLPTTDRSSVSPDTVQATEIKGDGDRWKCYKTRDAAKLGRPLKGRATTSPLHCGPCSSQCYLRWKCEMISQTAKMPTRNLIGQGLRTRTRHNQLYHHADLEIHMQGAVVTAGNRLVRATSKISPTNFPTITNAM